jgi:hypothetical protein
LSVELISHRCSTQQSVNIESVKGDTEHEEASSRQTEMSVTVAAQKKHEKDICHSLKLDVTLTERVLAQVYCSGTTIVNFVTSSPIGMAHSTIVDLGNGMYPLDA